MKLTTLTPSVAQVKNARIYTSDKPYSFMIHTWINFILEAIFLRLFLYIFRV